MSSSGTIRLLLYGCRFRQDGFSSSGTDLRSTLSHLSCFGAECKLVHSIFVAAARVSVRSAQFPLPRHELEFFPAEFPFT